MKRFSRIVGLCALMFGFFAIQPLKGFSLSSLGKVASKAVTVVGHVATGVDMAMGVANVGVTLWGSDTDKERFSKVAGYTSIVTSLAKGDIESAQASAEGIRGSGKADDIQYTPVPAKELAEADIVPVADQESTTSSTKTSSSGKIRTVPMLEIMPVVLTQKMITINDLKVAKIGSLTKQLVFLADNIPSAVGSRKLYRLLNGRGLLFEVQANKDLAGVIYGKAPDKCIALYELRTGPVSISDKNPFNPLTTSPFSTQELGEIGTITCTDEDLKKGFYVGVTNDELSIFHKQGNALKKAVLIPNMNSK